jgi:NAD(P)-dependent dehydrogenase (short-subunit alcohol dehydrogenase family)
MRSGNTDDWTCKILIPLFGKNTDQVRMVNNAGIAHEASNPRPVWETPLDLFDSTWNVNVRGVFLGCKYSGRQMLNQEKSPGEERNGTIINIASVLGILGKEGTPAYATAKGAVIAMTRTVAMDYAPHGIHCNSILPGCRSKIPAIA